MAERLDIHPASSEERLQIYENVHEFWPMASSLEEHLRLRLDSPKHQRAHWYAGCLGGKVVASLGCFPLSYYLDGREVKGLSIGSVHTRPEHRRRGFAAAVMDWAERHQVKQGARLSSLFSDIDPDYYAKQGYLRCPSWNARAEARAAPLGSGERAWTLQRFSAVRALPELQDIYHAYHGAYPLAVARSLEYWKYTLLKQPGDEFYGLKDPESRTRGYVRVTEMDGYWQISDFAVRRDRSDSLRRLFSLMIDLAGRKGKTGIEGWLPNEPAIRSLFELQPRTQSVTMVKSLDAGLTIEEKHLETADRICKIDHV
jgi:predicted acetyltransferase